MSLKLAAVVAAKPAIATDPTGRIALHIALD